MSSNSNLNLNFNEPASPTLRIKTDDSDGNGSGKDNGKEFFAEGYVQVDLGDGRIVYCPKDKVDLRFYNIET